MKDFKKWLKSRLKPFNIICFSIALVIMGCIIAFCTMINKKNSAYAWTYDSSSQVLTSQNHFDNAWLRSRLQYWNDTSSQFELRNYNYNETFSYNSISSDFTMSTYGPTDFELFNTSKGLYPFGVSDVQDMCLYFEYIEGGDLEFYTYNASGQQIGYYIISDGDSGYLSLGDIGNTCVSCYCTSWASYIENITLRYGVRTGSFSYEQPNISFINENGVAQYGQNQYNEGYSVGYQEGVNSSYNVGYSEGYAEGENVGIDEGKEIGQDIGYEIGYSEGAQSNFETNGFKTLISSIFMYPVNMIKGVFNFEFMGINVLGLITFVISIGIVIFVISYLRRK